MSNGIDILSQLNDIDLTTVDRTFPLIKESAVLAHIEEMRTEENAKKTGHNLIVKFLFDQKAHSTEGKELNEGFPLTQYISLVQTDKYNPAERLADLQNAVLGEQRKGFRFADFLGKQLVLKLKNKEGDDGVERTEIKGYKAVPAAKPLSAL